MVRYQRRVQRARAGRGAWSSTWHRGRRHRHRPRGRRGVQVHPGRLAARGRDPGHRRALQGHRPALRRACGTRSASTDGWQARRHTHTVVVLVGQREQGDAAGHRVRPLPGARPAPRGQRRHRRRGGERRWPSSGRSTTSRSSFTPSFSPYRNLTRPMLRFLDELDAESRDDIITVVIPEFVVNRWYLQILHNQTALALKARLLFRPNTVVTSVPIHIGDGRFLTPLAGTAVRDACARHVLDHQADPRREADRLDRGAAPAAPQVHRAAGLRVGRHLVHGLRHGRDPGRPAHPGPDRRGGLAVPGADRRSSSACC